MGGKEAISIKAQGTASLTKPAKPRFFYGYVVVVAASFVMLTASGASQTFSMFLKPLVADFGWTRAATSGAYFLNSGVSGLLRVIMGRLNDKLGPRLVITICSLFLGLGYVLMSRIDNIWQLYLFYGVVLGAGTGGDMIPVVSTVARWFVKKRGIVTGIVTSTSGLSQAVMPLLISRLIVTYDWRLAYLVIAAVALVPPLLGAQFMRRDPERMGQIPYGAEEAEAQTIATVPSSIPLSGAIRGGQFWIFCGLVATSAVAMGVVNVHIVAHATDIGMSVTDAANILVFVGAFGIAGRLVFGFTIDKIGSKVAMVIVFIVHAAAIIFLIWARAPWALYLFGAGLGFGIGGFVPAQSVIVADLFGLGSHGLLLGLGMLSITIGLGIGSFVAGKVFDITGSYTLAFIIAAVAMLVGLILTLMIKTSDKRGGASET
jgi:MFS family permease